MSDARPSERSMSRRNLLGLIGAAGAAAAVAACRTPGSGSPIGSPSTTSGPATTFPGGCVLIPKETAGPYPLDLSANAAMVRRDVTEGRPGVPLRLALTVLGVGQVCRPLANARVDLWQCDKDGVYSGYPAAGSRRGETFMRGIQRTGADGVVTFDTVFPGWYAGRATHLHFQVFLDDGLVATSQIAFPEDVTQAVYRSPLYSARGQNPMTNARDMVFADGTRYQTPTITGDVGSGLRAALTAGVATA